MFAFLLYSDAFSAFITCDDFLDDEMKYYESNRYQCEISPNASGAGSKKKKIRPFDPGSLLNHIMSIEFYQKYKDGEINKAAQHKYGTSKGYKLR